MDLGIKGRTALVCGASKGLGRACAQALAEAGVNLVIVARTADALNAAPESGSAQLAGQLIRETFARGGRACRPRIATPTLAAAFIDPALAFLQAKGAKVEMGKRLRNLVADRGKVLALEFSDATVPLNASDMVVLAVPPWVAKDLLPDLTVPTEFCAIVNGHFHCPAPKGAPPILGVIGGTVEWVFTFHDRISVTVSESPSPSISSRRCSNTTLR